LLFPSILLTIFPFEISKQAAMQILSKIVDFINDKFSFPVAAVCCFFLFMPDWILKRLNLLDFAYTWNEVISFVLVLSTILYLYGRGKKISRYIKSKLEGRTRRIARKRTVASQALGLRSEEKDWIYYCIKKNTRTLYAPETNDTAVALEGKTLVYRPKSVYDRLSTPFTIYPEVWKYLTKKKHKFCSHDHLKDREYNEKVEQFIKSLRSTE
jgi:hypothetical protein